VSSRDRLSQRPQDEHLRDHHRRPLRRGEHRAGLPPHCYLSKKCNGGNLAAVPGYSNHQSGHALDLNTSAGGVYSYLVNHGHAYGFRRTVPSEKWHWEH
jgi:hypothetical protein